MSYRILVVNPGSTSTKIGVYEDEQLLFDKTLRHSAEEIAQFNTIPAQKDWRRDLVMKALREQGFDARTLSAVSGRGGLLRPIRGGTYAVNDNMVKDCTIGVQGQHASNLGGLIAREIGDELGIPSYIVDPVVIDEMTDVARYAGHPLFQRVSIFHALNQKAVAKRYAKEHGKKYEDLNLIVCHMGGGVSIGAHMKGSVVGKMPGDYENQLRCTRGFYAYLLAHPGKKLLFMGPEIGQWHEWDSNGQLDWYLLEHAENQQLHAFFKAANAFYKAESALWDIDFDWQGFEWLVPDDNHNNVVVFLRRDQAGNELLCAVNFSPNDYENYRVGVPPRKRYVPAFTTDASEFGGSGFADTKPLTVKDTPSHGKEQSVALRLPAFGAVFLRGEGSFTKRGSATKVKKVKNRKRS